MLKTICSKRLWNFSICFTCLIRLIRFLLYYIFSASEKNIWITSRDDCIFLFISNNTENSLTSHKRLLEKPSLKINSQPSLIKFSFISNTYIQIFYKQITQYNILLKPSLLGRNFLLQM